tara:strand:+ start:113 stop:514 length:402 start_codon:yes stop_codon:yes gene_type:complete
MFERNTVTANAVVKLLTQSKNPLSVPKIIEGLNNISLFPNKSTVYRILEKLKYKNMIVEVFFKQGVVYYELTQDHHYHFFCNECQTVFCLDSTHNKNVKFDVSKLVSKTSSVQIQAHDFNFYGVCEPCLKESK